MTTGFAPWQELETLRLERAGGAARIVLARPETLNAWIPQTGLDLRHALRLCADDSVRAVVIGGDGRGFSSGADLRADHGLTSSELLIGYYHEALLAIRELPKPVVAAVHGAAAGIGCSLALACDLVVMAHSAFLLLAFVNVGLIPDGGASVLVGARAGAGRAAAMAMLGERVGAEQALSWGLANLVVPDDALAGATEELTARLAAGPTTSYALIKQTVNATAYAGLEAAMELEARLQDRAAATGDHREGAAAFLERRSPRFTGG
jgi:2-(1,2-epoxy-1,2-dihydrophenyl)acetyl-CoA isomerase